MRKGCLAADPIYHGNRIFQRDPSFDPNDTLAGFRSLKNAFLERGFDLSTQDINPPDESEFVLYNDRFPEDGSSTGNAYVLLLESEAVLPGNFQYDQLHRARKIFTWDDRIVNGRNILKVNYAFDFPSNFKLPEVEKTNFCVIISANKFSGHPRELYTAREKMARELPSSGPRRLDLYGYGWDRRVFPPGTHRFVRWLESKRSPYSPPASWRGPLGDKIGTLATYRFSICFENVGWIPGYITEKIIDCFLAGTVPVYLGAPNIESYIPRDCFVDASRFATADELWLHLLNMGEEEYQQRRQSIADFMNGPGGRSFGQAAFNEVVVNGILADL